MYKLYNGDCLEVMDKLINEKVKVDIIITSPPYNIGKEYEKKKDINIYLKWIEDVVAKCEKILKENGTIIWNVGTYVDDLGNGIPLSFLMYPIFIKKGFKLRQNIVWHFSSGLSAKKKLSARYEDILWLYKGDKMPVFNLEDIRVKEWKAYDKRNNPNGKNPTNVWHIEQIKGNSREKTKHPCQFPVKLIERCIKGMSNKDSVILDCFMGSGSTGVACAKTGRKFIGIELDNNYFNIASKRIEEAFFNAQNKEGAINEE